MKTIDSTKLWRTRIEKCKKSGINVTQWCRQNNISKYAYYYWHRKLIEPETPKVETSPIFAEVAKTETSNTLNHKSDGVEIVISWKDVSITINNQDAIPLVAKLLNSLEQLSC